MAITIKGFDQITATLAGVAISGGLFAVLWYGGKYLANIEAEREEKMVAKAEKELKSMASGGWTNPQSHGDKAPQGSLRAPSMETHEIWGYQGNLAPWYWGNLRADYKNCASKSGQSPIDISGAKLDETLKSLKMNYFHGVTAMTFHHSTIQGKIENGSWLDWDGARFELVSVRFRTPSEHRTNGLPWEMEAQLVHQSVSGAKIILAVFFTPGQSHGLLNQVTNHLPRVKDEVVDAERLNWQELLPRKRTYWSYQGSDTIPPCDPNVKWVVMTEPVQTSKASIDKLVAMQKSNVRPVFPLGQRALTKSNR